MMEPWRRIKKRILDDSIGRYFTSLVSTSIILYSAIFVLQHLHFKSMCENFLQCRFGSFFDWEVAIIVHTIFSFFAFTRDKEIKSILSADLRLWSSLIIWTSIGVAIASYFYASKSFSRDSPHQFFTIILMDSITFVPMLVFSITNLAFLLINFRDLRKRRFFGKLIVFLDLPFIIPYLIVVFYSYLNQDKIEVHTFLAGVATTLLLCSNLVTFAFYSFNIEFAVPTEASI